MITTAIAGACLASAFKNGLFRAIVLFGVGIGLTWWAWGFIDKGHAWPLAAGVVTFIYILGNG